MDATVIGVDAHKRSHTAVVLDDDEEILDQLRLVADRRQIERLLAWAGRWPDRVLRSRTPADSDDYSVSSWSHAVRRWSTSRAG